MRLGLLFKWIGVITILALVYIHLQMQIIDLAYQGKTNERQIKNLIDENGNVTYAILTKKSSSNLGRRLLEQNPDMQFVHPENILKISIADMPKDERYFIKSTEVEDKSVSMLGLLSLGVQWKARSKKDFRAK